jgi:hypothetical protein
MEDARLWVGVYVLSRDIDRVCFSDVNGHFM